MEEVTGPGGLEEERSESFYGNIGRCLHFMGQVDPALACYRTSAALAQESEAAYGLENQAFIREWIGELLEARGDGGTAIAFLAASAAKWARISPDRSERVAARAAALAAGYPTCGTVPDEQTSEATVLSWIAGNV